MLDFNVDRDACIRCGECAVTCVARIIFMTEDGPAIAPRDAARCLRCQQCLAVCPTGSISILGKDPRDSLNIQDAFPDPDAMLTLIKGRRSVRRYKKEAVPRETLDILLEAVSHAPTGVNMRDMIFTLVDDPAVMDKVRTETMEAVGALAEAGAIPEELAFFKDLYGLWLEGADPVFRGAPHLLVVSHDAQNPSGVNNATIALAYFELMAQSLGLGTLWCGLGKLAFTALVPEMCERLGIPESQRIGYAMVFGAPDVHFARTVQRDPSEVNIVTLD